MKRFYHKLIETKASSPDQQRKGRLLAHLLVISTYLLLVISIIDLYEWHTTRKAPDSFLILLDIFFIFIFLGIWIVNRQGFTKFAAIATLGSYMLGICLIPWTSQIQTVFWAFLIPTMMSSFILKPVTSFLVALIATVVYILSTYLTGVLESFDILFFKISGLAGVALLAYLTASYLDRAIESLNNSETNYLNLFENQPIGLYRTSVDGKILEVNSAFLDLFGIPSRVNISSMNAADLYAIPSTRNQHLSALDRRNFKPDEIIMRRQDGSTFWVNDHVRAIQDSTGEVLFYEGSLIDITERKHAEHNFEVLATTDVLTGLSNRRHFFAQADDIFSRADLSRAEIAVLMIDLDHFKKVNDKFGHVARDVVLTEIAG
jgi:PAS domain S-box-containing protein